MIHQLNILDTADYMHSVDYTIIIIYFLGIVLLASFFGKSQKSLKDFLLGNGQIPWWAAAFSGIATITSAISYIGAVDLGFNHDFSFLQYRLSMPLALLIICGVILPFFFKLNVYSIYEYLEKRFNAVVRMLGSGLFILFKSSFLAVGIYAPAIIINQLTGMDIIVVAVLTGLITTIYTLVGGMKAVVWTDVPQLLIMLGGIFLIIVVAVSGVNGGLLEAVKIADENDKFRYFNFSKDFTETYTVWGGIIGGFFLTISQFGTDQTEIQRFLTVKSVRKANLALIVSMIFAAGIGALIFFEGAMLFAFYEQRGQTNVGTNQVFMKFAMEELPIGTKGFLVSALFAASMSTISSVLNSLTTVFLSDFYTRFRKKEASVGYARRVTLTIGLFSTLLACFGGYLGNVLEAATSIINFFGGALVGMFLLGMLSRRTGPTGAIVGFIAGFTAVLLTTVGTDISFMWYSAIGATMTIVVGSLTSIIMKENVGGNKKALVYERKRPMAK